MLMTIHDNLLSEASVSQLLKLADAVTRSQIFFSLCVGATAEEVTALCWSDVNLVERWVWLQGQRDSLLGTRPRRNSIPPVLHAELVGIRNSAAGPDGLVWADAGGVSQIPLQARWSGLFSVWADAHRRLRADLAPPAVVPDWSALRDYTIDVLLRNGVPPQLVAVWAGIRTEEIEKGGIH